ncbi:hypothetical protein KY362_03820, partial [Candidatus Woesearchaeota archaeon]|nr:hypothetical protein [Candidatus Woesearchaeota archaeon]
NFWGWLQQAEPELFRNTKGAKDKGDTETYRANREALKTAHRTATQQGLYEVTLIPGVMDRFAADKAQGHEIMVYTGTPLTTEISDLGLADHVDELLIMDDLLKASGLVGRMKEDPETYIALVRHLRGTSRQPVAYTDDSPKRMTPAVAANRELGENGLGKLYLFDPKGKHQDGEGYVRIASLMEAE